MPEFKDIAVVAGTGKPARDLIELANGRVFNTPTPVTPDDLTTAAWMVFEFMLGNAHRQGDQEVVGAEPAGSAGAGQRAMVWYYWRGSMTAAINALTLAKGDSESERASFRKAINRWLRDHGNAVCLSHQQGRGDTLPVWGIRSVFREVTAPRSLPVFRMVGRYSHVTPGAFPTALKASQAEADSVTSTASTPAPVTTTLVPAHTPADPVTESPEFTADEVTHRHSKYTTGNSTGTISCPSCGDVYAGSHMARHFFRAHVDPAALLLQVLGQRGEVQDTGLADVMSEAAGGAVVTANYVNSVILEMMDRNLIVMRRGDRRTRWYSPVPGTTPVTSGVPVDISHPVTHLDDDVSDVVTPSGNSESAEREESLTVSAHDEQPQPAVSVLDLSQQQIVATAVTPATQPGDSLPAAIADLMAAADRVLDLARSSAHRENELLQANEVLRERNTTLEDYRARIKKMLAE